MEGRNVFVLEVFNDLDLDVPYYCGMILEDIVVFLIFYGCFGVFAVGSGNCIWHHGFVRFDLIVSSDIIEYISHGGPHADGMETLER